MNIDSHILTHRLFIDDKYDDFVQLFCNTSNDMKNSEKYLLSNWYEGYIYTALLGLKLGLVFSFSTLLAIIELPSFEFC